MDPLFLGKSLRDDGYADYVWSIRPGFNVTLTGPWEHGTLDTPTPGTLGILRALTERTGHHAPRES